MKKIILLALLAFGMWANAQKSKKNHFEYFTVSLAVDPNATMKEQSPNLAAELEYVNNIFYVKASAQTLPDLEGGYFDYGGGVGINIFLDRWKESRIYYGARLGVIKRGGESYPLVGFEGGYDYLITDKMFLGIRATGDYRSDFEFWGGEAKLRYSGFIRIGWKF